MGPQDGCSPLLLDQVAAGRPVRVGKDEVLQTASRHQLGREPAPGAATPDERCPGTPRPVCDGSGQAIRQHMVVLGPLLGDDRLGGLPDLPPVALGAGLDEGDQQIGSCHVDVPLSVAWGSGSRVRTTLARPSVDRKARAPPNVAR